MVLAVSKVVDEKKTLDLVAPPEGSKPGDRIVCEGCDSEIEPGIKGKRYTRIMGGLTTDSEGFPCFKGIRFQTVNGYCPPSKIQDGTIS